MTNYYCRTIFASLIGIILVNSSIAQQGNTDLERAQLTLRQIYSLYDPDQNNVFNETYPARQLKNSENELQPAFLWPTSAVFSGVNELLSATGNRKYRRMLEKNILPCLNNYYDNKRNPAGYQSGLISAGLSDRYYDDDIWLAIDFCESYRLTGKSVYLEKSEETWKFIMSGFDEMLGGGIYWCEQKKQSKNTCSNAPAAVLAFRLFEATGDSAYFRQGLKIYNWTMEILQDTTDNLYFDNSDLTGKIDRRKYTYNSGQMLQASAILYRLTGEKQYLAEASGIAASVINHFTEEFVTPEGKQIRLFKNSGNWFNYILLRGYTELYLIDRNPLYINIYRDNMEQVWNHTRDNNGLFGKDWKGQKETRNKELLDQAGLMAIWGMLAGVKQESSRD